jgi:hypothetical protein
MSIFVPGCAEMTSSDGELFAKKLNSCKDAHVSNMSVFETGDHLRADQLN